MDKKNLRFLFVGVFLAVVLLTSFIFAVSYDVAPSTAAKAGETVSLLKFNITSTTGINTNLTTVTLELTGNVSIGNITSVNISDGTNDYSNGSITGTTITIDVSDVNASAQGNTNLTINATLNSSATYNHAFGLNITSVGVQSSNVTVDVATNSSLVLVTETTAPTATAACTGDIFISDPFPCTCSGTDSGVTASGVSTSVGTSTSGSITDTSVTGVFTYTCTVTDVAGNSASSTKQYVVFTVGGGDSGGGSSEQLPQKKHTLSKITPGVVSIVKNFDPEIGVKQITIEVNNEVQNVKITVTKYDGKPAQVSKERSGKVYQYFEVDATNLLDSNLNKATMRVKVEKTWVSSEGLEKNDVLVFKFDESAEEWKELGTKYVEEDNTYYYYDVELDSLSFFAISAKTLTEKAEEVVGDVGKKVAKDGKNKLLIVLFILGGLAVWFYFFRGKKK